MQPERAMAASPKTSDLVRNLRPRGVMGGASLFLHFLMAVQAHIGRLVAVVRLNRIHDDGVVASRRNHVQRVANCRSRAGRAVSKSDTGGTAERAHVLN